MQKTTDPFSSSPVPVSSWARKNFIGKGSYGSVSLAVSNLGDGRLFAVKSVDKNSSCSQFQLQALENEISILRSLSSPYVVTYSGDDVTVEQSDSSPASSLFRNLHLEYLPGGTAADAGNDEDTVRRYAWCVASALKYVHSMGIVHCDVKGKNVLLGNCNAKLADFGSARRLSAPPEKKITPRGSPLWMAPEVVRGESQGFESDVWSFGCTVIEMLTGKPPWKDEGADTLCRIGCSNELPEFPSQLSELGRDFLDKCLRREPSQRWSCEQLLHHPFLSSSAPPAIQTPRSVLHWSNSDVSSVSEEDDEEGMELGDAELLFSDSGERGISSAQRIAKLATASEANWESDGWVEVRSLGRHVVEHGGGGASMVAGTSTSECFDLIRGDWESECSTAWMDAEGIDGGRGGASGVRCGGCGAGSTGHEEEGRAVEEREIDSSAVATRGEEKVGEVAGHSHGGECSLLLFFVSKLFFVVLLCSTKSRNNVNNNMEMKSLHGYILFFFLIHRQI